MATARTMIERRVVLHLEELEPRNLLASVSNFPPAVELTALLTSAANPPANRIPAITGGIAAQAPTAFPIGSLVGIPPGAGLLPQALATSRLNTQIITGSIYPIGTLEDENFVTVPSPFARLAGQADQIITRSPALSGTLIGLGESFKGSNDDLRDNAVRDLFSAPQTLGFPANGDDADAGAQIDAATGQVVLEMIGMPVSLQ